MDLPVNYNLLSSAKRKAVRLEYVERQGGLCCHCKQPLDGEPSKNVKAKSVNERLFPMGFFNNPVHLHHDHKTGATIGAVHAKCNAVLWQYHGK